MSAKLTVEIGAVITELQRGLSDAQAQIGSFANKAGARMKKLSEDIGASGVAMSAGVTVPLTAMAAASIKAFGEIESLKKGLIAVSGSAAAADKQFESLTEVAKLPGLGLNEAVKGAIRLQTIGFSAEQAKQSLMVFGNAIATVGGGRDELERAIYGLQQLANTEFPLGEDLNIIKDAIPQVTPLLKEAFGTARTEDLQKLGITSKQVVDTITKGLAALPPVAGGVKNAFENLSDSSTQAFAKIGEVLNERLNLTGMINALGDAIGGVVDWFTNLDPIVQDIILGVAALVAAIGPLLVAFQGVVYIAPILGAAITAIGGPFTILAAVVGVVAIAIIKNWDRVKAFLLDSAATILNNLAGFVGKIANLADKIGLDSVAEKFRSYADAITGKSKEMSDSSRALTATLKEVTDTTKAATDANNKKASSLNAVAVAAKNAANGVKVYRDSQGLQPVNTAGVQNNGAPSTTNLLPDMGAEIAKSTATIPEHLNETKLTMQNFAADMEGLVTGTY